MYRLSLALIISTALAAPAGAEPGYRLLDIDGHHVRWGAPGQDAVVTYRLAFTDAPVAGRDNCKRTAGLDRLIAHSGLARRELTDAAATAFALWSEVADIRFTPAASGAPADITITSEAEPDGIAFTDVRSGPAPDGTVAPLAAAIICLNPQASWSAADATPGKYRLYYVLAHEIGHAIGLDHPDPSGTLMSFEYDPRRKGLADGDRAGVRALYGAAVKADVMNVN